MRDLVNSLAQQSDILTTPAFICDLQQLGEDIDIVAQAIKDDRTKLLFAMKSFSIVVGLKCIAQSVSGLHASSLFEARLARQILGDKGIVHLTTPGLRADEIAELSQLCDYVSFNSLNQWQNMREHLQGEVNCGLRINPQLSLVPDKRYDPCRSHSRLGVALEQLQEVYREDAVLIRGINGLLFHTNCDASDFHMLLETVEHLQKNIPQLLEQISWINLGGGYLFNETDDFQPLKQAIEILHIYEIDILFEPGASISRKAGYLVSEVLDIFESEGSQIVVLDTTVNHMPEVFEYQFKPDIIDELEEGDNHYIITGSTCLAGDIFGEYIFQQPLQIGSRIVFENAGAYTMVKAHMFNGVNLPSIYVLSDNGELMLKKTFTFDDYLTHCGV